MTENVGTKVLMYIEGSTQGRQYQVNATIVEILEHTLALQLKPKTEGPNEYGQIVWLTKLDFQRALTSTHIIILEYGMLNK